MRKLRLTVTLMLAFCLLFTLTACGGTGGEETQEKYVLYIGFAEKTDEETDAIIETVNGICRKYVSGYTMYEGEGGWTDDNGTFTAEETLIYCFNFTEEDKVVAIAHEVMEMVPGSAVLFETQYTNAVHSSSEDFPAK